MYGSYYREFNSPWGSWPIAHVQYNHQNSNMTPRLSGQTSTFGFVFFVSSDIKPLVGLIIPKLNF